MTGSSSLNEKLSKICFKEIIVLVFKSISRLDYLISFDVKWEYQELEIVKQINEFSYIFRKCWRKNADLLR